MLASAALVFALALPAVLADPVPTAPGPSDVFKAGSQCTITWTADPTGTWTEMNIELMTGPNNPMVHMRTVATVDATKTTSYSWTCPEVNPYSPIYFYQFSSATAPANLTWTTRFTIASASGQSVPPTETNPQGIKYGTGAFVDTSNYNAQPSYLAGSGEIVGGGGGSGSGSSSASTPVSSGSASPTVGSSTPLSDATSTAALSAKSRSSAVLQSPTSSGMQTSTQASATTAPQTTSGSGSPISGSTGAAPLRASLSGSASVFVVLSTSLFGAVLLL